jgi:tetratricopeptide (TPR) repeat protein
VPDETLAVCKKALAAGEETGNLKIIFNGQFQIGFAHLWREELDDARIFFEQALSTADQLGASGSRLMALMYLAITARMGGDAEQLRELAPICLELAGSEQNRGYLAIAYGHLAWLAWHDGDISEAHRLAETGEEVMYPSYPLIYLHQLLLLGTLIENGNTARAVEVVRKLLSGRRKRLPDAITDPLIETVDQWDAVHPAAAERLLRQAIRAAQDTGYF